VSLSTILNSGVVAALVGGLVGGLVGFFLQNRPAAKAAKRRHRAAVVAVLTELKGIEHVVDLMLEDEATKSLPTSDVAYRAMSGELLHGLRDERVALVVKAYTQMPLLVRAVEHARTETPLSDSSSRQIKFLEEDLSAAVAGLTIHLANL
jgi:hypothetical protein